MITFWKTTTLLSFVFVFQLTVAFPLKRYHEQNGGIKQFRRNTNIDNMKDKEEVIGDNANEQISRLGDTKTLLEDLSKNRKKTIIQYKLCDIN